MTVMILSEVYHDRGLGFEARQPDSEGSGCWLRLSSLQTLNLNQHSNPARLFIQNK